MDAVRSLRVLPEYRLELEFEDGFVGVVDLSRQLWGEVFEPLRDESRFAEAKVDAELGTVVWPGGADFSPEFLREHAVPVVASA
jgi:hypothetical protein